MNALTYLFFTKLKAQMRRLFSRPSSAIITLLCLAFFGWMLAAAAANSQMLSTIVSVRSVQSWMMLYCGYVLFLMTVMILQKRTAVVTRDDAQFIFAGPFTRRQTMAYLLVETVEGSLIYALFGVVYVLMMMSGSVKLTLSLIGMLILASLLMFYFVFALITYFYFLELVRPSMRKVKIGLLVLLLGFIGAIALRNAVVSSVFMDGMLTRLVADPLFDWIPIFGWCKNALVSFVSGNAAVSLLMLGLSFAVCALITVLILNVKGNFYEQAIMDAEWVSELRKNARSRGTASANGKISEVKNVRFAGGAGSLISKNLLILRKTRKLISLQELIMIILYMGIVWMNGQGFAFYQYFILIVVFMSATTDSIAQDLRVFYLYLIPDKPYRKLLALTVPSMLHMTAVVAASVVLTPLVLHASLSEVIAGTLLLLGFGWLFLCSSLVCLRLMKTRQTVMVEQLIKMGLSLFCCIPSVIVMVAAAMQFHWGAIALNAAALAVNFLVGLGLLKLACPLLSGNNLLSD